MPSVLTPPSGPGNKQLANKRQWAVAQDVNMKRERQANWLARIEGINTLRKGTIKIDYIIGLIWV